MKKRTLAIVLALVTLVFIGAVQASGGDADDPLISLDFLSGIFHDRAEDAVSEKLDVSDEKLLGDALSEWERLLAAAEANAGSEHTSVFREAMCKQGDLLSGPTGLQIIVLSGRVSVQFSAGAVVDATDGRELASGSIVPLGHRLLVAENTTALFTVVSKTAVLDYCGSYYFALSSTPDYNAMASALRELHLFRGTGAGFGEGFELDRAPSRVEALVMLIRLLGEENAALATTAKAPFTDVDDWAVPYVAYAYERGYSNGVGGGLFGSSLTANAKMYTEFILRALGYSSTAQSDISDALDRAYAAGILTSGERTSLQSGSFLRADVTYLSYYALSATVALSDATLAEVLEDALVFSRSDYRSASALVTTSRLR